MKRSRMSSDDRRDLRDEIAYALDPWDDYPDEESLAPRDSDWDYVSVNQRFARGYCPACHGAIVYRQSVKRGLVPMPHANWFGPCRGVRIPGLTLCGPSLRCGIRRTKHAAKLLPRSL